MFPTRSTRIVAGWTLRGVLAAGLLLGAALPRSASAGEELPARGLGDVQAVNGAGHGFLIAGGVADVRGSGEEVEIIYGKGLSAVIAGGVADVRGSGENVEIIYGEGHGAVIAGGVVEVRGSGEDVQIVYGEGQEASVVAGRGQAPVVAQDATAPAPLVR